MIDGYVAEVVLLSPRRQRADVALELRDLIAEEAAAAAADRGRGGDRGAGRVWPPRRRGRPLPPAGHPDRPVGLPALPLAVRQWRRPDFVWSPAATRRPRPT